MGACGWDDFAPNGDIPQGHQLLHGASTRTIPTVLAHLGLKYSRNNNPPPPISSHQAKPPCSAAPNPALPAQKQAEQRLQEWFVFNNAIYIPLST